MNSNFGNDDYGEIENEFSDTFNTNVDDSSIILSDEDLTIVESVIPDESVDLDDTDSVEEYKRIDIDLLEETLNKYYLNGICNKALVKDGDANRFVSQDDIKSIVVDVICKTNLFEVSKEFGIVDTKSLLTVAKLFDISTSYTLTEDKLVLSSVDSEYSLNADINLADSDMVNSVKFRLPTKAPKDFDIEFDVTPAIAELIKKTETALAAQKLFYFTFKKNNLYLVVGSEEEKTNKVNILIPDNGKIKKFVDKLYFQLNYLTSILKVNKDSDINIKVSLLGVMVITTNSLNHTVTYYMGSKQVNR